MIQLGKYQNLQVQRRASIGLFLGEDEKETVLLPIKYVPKGAGIGDRLRVFVHNDSEGRPIATTLKPAAELGGFGAMKVVDLSPHGAFMAWGVDKDLFVPNAEQRRPLIVGTTHVIAVCLDEATNRLIGTTRFNDLFDEAPEDLAVGREVEVLVYGFLEVGAQVVVDQRYRGIVFKSDTHRRLLVGEQLRGWITGVRDDGKVDVRLRPPGRAAEVDAQDVVLAALKENDGFLALHDKSSPKAIGERLDMSKKVFKAAIGGLYRRELITLEPGGIRLR